MRRASSARMFAPLRLWVTCLLLASFYGAPASAISVNRLTYDAAEDQLILLIAYRGTNPDHKFSVEWTECKRLDDERSEILGLLVDNQPDDLARQEFTQVLKVDLTSFTCRPSKVTIRTSAGFFTSVDVPAAPKNKTAPVSDARNAP